jgi:hypothetical protein
MYAVDLCYSRRNDDRRVGVRGIYGVRNERSKLRNERSKLYIFFMIARTPDRRRRVGVRVIYGVRNERSKLS